MFMTTVISCKYGAPMVINTPDPGQSQVLENDTDLNEEDK